MNWTKCKECYLARKIRIDNSKILNLKRVAKNKTTTANSIPLTNISKESILTLLYDSLRTLLEALSIKHGYKIYNHECYSAFLIEELNEDKLGKLFDKIRIIRNKINYYGESYNIKIISINILKINNLIDKVKLLL